MSIPLFHTDPNIKPITNEEIAALTAVLVMAELTADEMVEKTETWNDIPYYQRFLARRAFILMRDEFKNLAYEASLYDEPVQLMASRICPVCDSLLYSSGWCPVCNG